MNGDGTKRQKDRKERGGSERRYKRRDYRKVVGKWAAVAVVVVVVMAMVAARWLAQMAGDREVREEK